MSENLRKVIQKQELFSKKDALLIGVSGGMDSMVMCQLLYEAGYSFIIAHCNYHLRDSESDLDEQLVRKWAHDRNIPCFVRSCQLIVKKNLQEEARKLRYAFFNELKASENCNYILTAHHANDQVETFFINLSRGAGLKGLKGMLMKDGDLIRPLLFILKKEIQDYAIEQNVPYREDQTNQSIDYLRNYFRNDVIPLIHNRISVFSTMALRSMHHLAELDLFVEQEFQEWKNANLTKDSNGLRIAKTKFEKFYLISCLLIELGFHPETIHQIKINYSKVGRRYFDKNEHELLIDRDSILIRTTNIENNNATYLISRGHGTLNLHFASLNWSTETKINDSTFLTITNCEAYIDTKTIQFPLLFRKWMPGDVIRPYGMNGKSKKLQDVLTNCKISVFEKENIYVLISGEDILWIPGILRSEIAKIDEHTESFLQLEWMR